MRKEILETKVMQTIGDYTIVKSVEQTYWDNGKKFGRAKSWYDICLCDGEGDIVDSYYKLRDAKIRAKEMDICDKKVQCMQMDFENLTNNGMGTWEKIHAFYDNISERTLYKIYEEYFGKGE